MNVVLKLLKWDVILLYRNSLFQISGIVTLFYIAIFYLLRGLGNLYIPLIVLIFNDPVVICYMFAGVLWLFDRSQNTLQAISILPFPKIDYLISKTLALSLLALILSILMAIAAVGFNFNFLHLTISVFFTSAMYCGLGFMIGSGSTNFLAFLMKSLPIMILSAGPFLLFYEPMNAGWILPFPTLGSVMLLQSAFIEKSFTFTLLGYVDLFIWTAIILKLSFKVTLNKIQ